MNTAIPKNMHPDLNSRGYSSMKKTFNPSFKSDAATIITSAKDKALNKVFSQYYGNIGGRIGEKLHKLVSQSEFLKKSSRFSYADDGALLIKDKKAGRLLLENILLPFINLPLNAVNILLKKLQGFDVLKDKAKSIYNKPLFRLPRKLNELDTKTDILKGIFEKTEQTINEFAKEKGVNPEKLTAVLSGRDKSPGTEKLAQEANDYIREKLYKSGCKFFDKHTGNFNTAYERPLNRVITGVIPITFLANDAYNLSVLCGDKKEDSLNEAKARRRQEIIRIFTTAYIQLLIFGAFTKQVNTISWFAPVTTAATALVSEIFSRKKLNRPVFFLSKERAQEYNKNNNSENSRNNTQQTAKNVSDAVKNINFTDNSKIFKGFNSSSAAFRGEKKSDKKEEKALINFKTFKKGVIGLTGAFFALSFIKNSTYTKNTKLVQGVINLGKTIQEKLYEPFAYKDFEISEKKFGSVMQSLRDTGCGKTAEGHEFIKNKYSFISDGIVKMKKAVLDDEHTEKTLNEVITKALNIKPELKADEQEIISQAVKTALRLGSADIAEQKFERTAEKASDIIIKKHVNLDEHQAEALKKSISDAIALNADYETVKIDSKIKPFIDIAVEPFKFVYSAAKLPFKIVTSLVNMAAAKIEKKAAQAELGNAELKAYEKYIHKAVTEIFGEKQGKADKISQTIFANAMEQLEKKTQPYRKAQKALEDAVKAGKDKAVIDKLTQKVLDAKGKLALYVDTAAAKSFNGITQSNNKNTDLAMVSKLASSTVTTAFLVADNYNMVMLKSNGENKEEAKEKANERIIQRLSGLFYQALFINWFNATFRSTYNSSLLGMTAVAVPNTLTTEILTRKSIGMPIRRKTKEQLDKIDEENENKKGLAGKYFKFMRLLTGKKPLKERLPKHKRSAAGAAVKPETKSRTSTNVLEMLYKK